MDEERFRKWLQERNWRPDAIESICVEVLDAARRIAAELGILDPMEEQLEILASEQRTAMVVDVSLLDDGFGTLEEIL